MTASEPSASRLASYLSGLGIQAPPDRLSLETVAYAAALDVVARAAPEVARSIEAELADQRSNLKLIASENYASPAVLLAMGNWLSDKYAEGAPGHRFYAGCDNVDAVERRAVELAKRLFGSDHAYIQPHSGIDANLVAFWSVLTDRVEAPALERLGARDLLSLPEEEWQRLRRELGNQRMLGMALDAGGHLTHGFRPNVSGKLFELSHYSVDPQTNLIDYDLVRERALQVRPLLLLAGYSSYPRRINFRIFREIADEVGATLMVDMAHFAGLVAGGVFTGDFDPVRHAQVVTTTTHKTLRGPRGGMVLCEARLAPTVDRGCPLVLGGPLPHVMAAKAVALDEASRPEFAGYARRVVDNAAALAEAFQQEGGAVVTGGTDNHLALFDVRPFGLTGRQAESALRAAGITANRNVIPYDPNGSWYTSGVRVGTPAATTLGMGTDEMREIASIMHGVLAATGPDPSSKARFQLLDQVRDGARKRVGDLLAAYRLYPEIAL
ncbi:MAG TPA: glycine hydroxymethyltransferase [Actinomycetes bacterium]|jgi:glycine hydroxymethyltransferase|nr:glycine hydroxymethyltransferase [Actinomycetes bacterium]